MGHGKFLPRRRRLALATIAALLQPAIALADSELFSQSFVSAGYARLHPLVWPAIKLLGVKKARQALPLLEQGRSYIEEMPEERWPFRMYVLPSYGFALLVLGRNEEAVEVLSQAVAAYERIQAENLTVFKQILAQIEESEGKSVIKVETARQLLSVVTTSSIPFPTVAESMFDRSIGTGNIFFSLGRAFRETGRATELVTLYEKHIRPPGDAKMDRNTAIAQEYRVFKFAVLLFQAGRPDVAEKALELALRMNTNRFREMLAADATVELVWSTFVRQRVIASALFQVVGQNAMDEPKSIELLTHLLRSKGGAVRYLVRLNQLLDRSGSDRVRSQRDLMYAIEDKMATLPPTRLGVERLLDFSGRHGFHMAQAIRELAAPESLSYDSFNPLDLQQIRSNLHGQAVVGFILYSPLARDTFGAAPPRYLRYCITAAQFQLQDIGEQRAVDRAARSFRLDLISGDNGSQMGKALAQRLLSGLPRSVEKATQWIIDPDGALCLVPFEALAEAGGRPGIGLRSYRYVTSLEQLRPLPPQPKQQAHACIIANPEYGTPETDSSASSKQMPARNPGSLLDPRDYAVMTSSLTAQQAKDLAGMLDRIGISVEPPDSSDPSGQTPLKSSATLLDLREFSITPLPDTIQEAQAVAGALERIGISVERFEGARATSEVLRSVQSPAVLHIASHALLFSSNKADSDWVPDDPYGAFELVLPGRRAGLVLSGGNKPALLLAKDIARLPLRDTALVVLSACNTGNGDVVEGEGVASLRRAVELAGARSSVTALWAVPSQATTELMASFYQNISRGLSLAEALRQAKLQKARQGRPPVEWAGFVLTGQNDVLAAGARGTANGQARQTLL